MYAVVVFIIKLDFFDLSSAYCVLHALAWSWHAVHSVGKIWLTFLRYVIDITLDIQ